jgi:acetylornithine deacetylase/succinyl-diaminopimelate desuccinylase-like protein
MLTMPDWKSYLSDHQSRFVAELADFLRIPSISSISTHAGDVRRAAQWVSDRLAAAGMEHLEIMETGGHPVVYADWLHAPGKPTALIYGHFDVQPVDPLSLWTHPPFEPHIEDDRIYARGASDDKGNMFAPIIALEALLKATGSLPINIKVFFEGQEEIGSPTIGAWLPTVKEKFACDLVINADGGQWDVDQPIISVGLRGGCGVQIDVKGPQMDVHSGMYGGVIMNPIHAVVSILNSMHTSDGMISVPGFYDQVRPVTPAVRAAIARVPHDEADVKQALGISELYGEAGFTPLEREWVRPTLEINGIYGGFQAEGIKTVLPSEAHAKITCRLVPDQDPEQIVELLKAHIARHTPPGVTVTVTPLAFRAYPYLIPDDEPGNAVIREVLMEMYDGKEPYYVRSGGSVPVCTLFERNLGVYTYGFGFGLSDELVHSPNEFFRLSSFRKSQQGYCTLLERLGR